MFKRNFYSPAWFLANYLLSFACECAWKKLWAQLWRMRIACLVLLITLADRFRVSSLAAQQYYQRPGPVLSTWSPGPKTGLLRRIERCVDQMYHLRALFAASKGIEAGEWDRYIATLSVREEDLGIRSMGYIGKVPPAGKDESLKRRRAVPTRILPSTRKGNARHLIRRSI